MRPIDPLEEAKKRVYPTHAAHEIIVTAHLLYDVAVCDHRIWMDLMSDAVPDRVNPFVELLWRRESQYTTKVYEKMRQENPDALDLTRVTDYGIRANRTVRALRSQVALILGGVLDVDNLRAEPNFLRLDGDLYRAGIIKSGVGREQRGEDDDEGKLKPHYAVEVALSIDALHRLGIPHWRVGEVYDINGDLEPYDLTRSYKQDTTFLDWYKEQCDRVIEILNAEKAKKPITQAAFGSVCKLCHWYEHCLSDLLALDDVTLIPHLGRARRRTIRNLATTREELAACNPNSQSVTGIRDQEFRVLVARARLMVEGRRDPRAGHPYLTDDTIDGLHRDNKDDIFFDVETDPLRDVCYLHGFAERLRGSKDFTYTGFFAEPEDERSAFEQAMAYLRERPDHIIYHYSAYEKSIYRRLQRRYPDISSPEEIDALFDFGRGVDLYYVVRGRKGSALSIWPTIDHSLKTLAKSEFVGFKWADANPSGAASVEWFDRWMIERDPAWKTRILVYNEDDCVGMAWLLDAMRRFPIRSLDAPPNTLSFSGDKK